MENRAMPFLAPERLLTPRLELRQFRLDDHEAYSRMCADPQVMRYIGTGEPHGPDLSWRAIAGFLGHWDLLGYGQWAVARRDDGVLLGRCGFFDPYGWPGFELGYLFAREHWGRGYAREAARAALDVATGVLKKERVISLIRPQNEPSVKLAQALGARLEGTIDFMGAPAQVYRYGGDRAAA
jgi:RimJ/RimL family protein N-acetyltransferase